MPKGWIGKPTHTFWRWGHGWVREIDRCFVDEGHNYAVMIRTVDTPWGQVEHAAIRNNHSSDFLWSEKQRIKNEIFGVERVAVEVYPAESELVDEANMYHLWVLPEGMKLPFTLANRAKEASTNV